MLHRRPLFSPTKMTPWWSARARTSNRFASWSTWVPCPALRLKKAQDEVQDALDMSLLKQNLYNPQLLPEQVDQLVILARNMVVRRQAAMATDRATGQRRRCFPR